MNDGTFLDNIKFRKSRQDLMELNNSVLCLIGLHKTFAACWIKRHKWNIQFLVKNRFLESVKLQQSLEEQRTRLAEAGLLQRAEECAQLWEILCEALDQFVELLGEEPITTDEFQRLLRQVLTQYSVGTIPAALDQVTVGDISRNDRHTCRYFFLRATGTSWRRWGCVWRPGAWSR